MFHREDRYLILKRKDLEKYLTEEDKIQLNFIRSKVFVGRREEGKEPMNAVVVEQDWPEFETVWSMIEKRVESES